MSASREIRGSGAHAGKAPRWLYLWLIWNTLVIWLLGACAEAMTPAPTPTLPLPTSTQPFYDCSLVERLRADSPEARQIAEQMIANYNQDYPKAPLTLVQVWGVERMGEYAVIRGMFQPEQIDLVAARREARGYVLQAHYIVDTPGPENELIPNFFIARVPDGPPTLFFCIDPRPYVGADQ
ncbi:MAG: hypothetical protein JXB15_06705 [Anaerolineales bacterium]|nr:hypothetical protein [Anaerolineales bacterium]